MKLQIVVCLFVIVGCVSANELLLKRELVKQSKICSTENNMTPEAIQKLISGDVSQDDENTKCYVNCFIHKIGLILDSGELNDVKANRIIPLLKDPVEGQRLYNDCKHLKIGQDCESSWELYKCFKARN